MVVDLGPELDKRLTFFFMQINVGGFIHFWGLTIDVVSCINLIIAVGLCVDYAAHVAHNFIGHEGNIIIRILHIITSDLPS